MVFFPGTGCFCFPQSWETCLAMLPRFWLNQLEIRAVPTFFSDQKFAEIMEFWQSRKVAFVRQSACLVSYEAAPSLTWMERVLSAKRHPGPLSLMAELSADFYVVRQAQEEETFAWKGKHQGDPNPAETFRRMEEYRLREEAKPGVVSCNEVPWDDYDLVICLDIPVPTRIIQTTRRTLWAYLSVEGGGPLQEASERGPVAGYHLFLNHHFRRFRVRPRIADHMVEFPFSFQSRKAWMDLQAYLGLQGTMREGTVLDRASAAELRSPLTSGFEVLGSDGRELALADLVRLYRSKKYALRLDRHRRWGNWLPEVIHSGCIFLGRLESLENRSPLLPPLVVENFRQARDKIESLEKDPNLSQILQDLQSKVMEHVAFRRPLADLTRKFREFFG